MANLSQREIAKALEISQATVSLVVNDPKTPLIAPATRDKVIKYCRANGYKVGNQRVATDYIGVLLDIENLSGRSQVHHLLGGLHAAARSEGKNLIFEQPDIEPEGLIRKAPFAGLVVADLISEEKIEQLQQFIPIVFVNHFFNLSNADCVVSDNEGGAVQAAEALIARGHKRILCFGNDPKLEPKQDLRAKRRLNGFIDACGARGIEPVIDIRPFASFTNETFAEMVERHLRKAGVTGVFALHDFLGVSFMVNAARAGLSAPDDYSILGFGDGERCLYTNPQMASIGEEFAEMGKTALEMILHRIGNQDQRPARKIVCSTKLVERPSLAQVPRRSSRKK